MLLIQTEVFFAIPYCIFRVQYFLLRMNQEIQ